MLEKEMFLGFVLDSEILLQLQLVYGWGNSKVNMHHASCVC